MPSRSASPQPPRPPRPSSPFGIPFPVMLPASSLSSPLSTPSPSPRRPHTPLSRANTPAPLILAAHNGGPQLPELGLKIPVRSPTPRSTKVSLWIDRLPRRAPHDVEREVRRVFEAGGGVGPDGPVRRAVGSRTRSLGTIDGLCAASSLRRLEAADEQATQSLKPSDKLVWWNLNSPVASPVISQDLLLSFAGGHMRLPSSPSSKPRASADGNSSNFYQHLSRQSSTSTLTPSSSSPSTPSLVYPSDISTNSSTSFITTAGEADGRSDDGDDDDEERTSHTSTPTPTLSPLSPGFGSSAIPRATQRPLRLQPPFASLKRRSTTGDLLGQYLVSEHDFADHPPTSAPVAQRPAPSPAPVTVSAPAVPRVKDGARIGGGGGLPQRKKLPWRLGMWRREK